MQHPVLAKVAAIGATALLLSIALFQISSIVDERQARQREAERSVAQGLAGPQAVLGPVLQRACREEWEATIGSGDDKSVKTEQRDFLVAQAPATLTATADVALEPRHRGLFKVNAYAATSTLRAHWSELSALVPQREHTGSRLVCGAPTVMVAVSDVRGVRLAQVRTGGLAAAVQPGTGHAGYPRGFHAELPGPWTDASAAGPLDVELALELAGTSQLAMAPVAQANNLKMQSNWPHPSFGGRFLPTERTVDDKGFSATWRVSSLASTAPADFTRGAPLCEPDGSLGDPSPPTAAAASARSCIETFSAAFIDPVNPYSLSDRAIKYGLLFIGLTFVAVSATEVLRQLRVHPVQYGLVGAALTLFFLLLLSLSEQLPFALAYTVASAACAGLLAFYGAHMLRSRPAGAWFGGGIACLYGVLYVLLQLEQVALLMGSLLLFAVLASIMVLTRRIDWYARLAPNVAPREAVTPPASR